MFAREVSGFLNIYSIGLNFYETNFSLFNNTYLIYKVKLGKYTCPPPAAMVGEELKRRDPMLCPKWGERVKYLVIAGNLS